MYSEQHLNISGKRSIAFMGREIASASNRDTSKETVNEWETVLVYEIDPDWAAEQERKNGKKIEPYTMGIAKCTKWLGSRDRYKVDHPSTIEQILDIVRRKVPIFHREIAEQLRLNTPPRRTLEYESSRSPVES